MTAGSPWFRAANLPEGEPDPQAIPAPAYETPAYEAETAVYEAIPAQEGHGAPQASQAPQEAYGGPYGAPYGTAGQAPYGTAADAPYEAAGAAPYEPPVAASYEQASGRSYESASGTSYEPAVAASYEPVVEAVPEAPSYGDAHAPERDAAYDSAHDTPDDDGTMALRAVEPGAAPLAGPGRAERRRAARRKGRAPEPAAPTEPAAPLSRVEARRAARAAKESLGVVLSRVVGELFITFGVVMLLFVTYQLWWTNVRAGQETDQAKAEIENSWSQGQSRPEAFEPGQGFAIMYIPKLDVVVPIAEGIDKTKVLDKGMAGHYAEGRLKTAMPSDKQGNFAVAGHRNTHGEPFRYINQLKPGDPIVVETQDAYYTYEMASILPQTAPSNVAVIDPVPKGSGFTKPGRYITLTTCTPEFTSTYRMIVWGKLVEERPRSKGKPAALVG